MFWKWVCGAAVTTLLSRDATLADLALFPISVDPETDRQAWGPTVRLAEAASIASI